MGKSRFVGQLGVGLWILMITVASSAPCRAGGSLSVPEDFATIQEAINAASAGDTVQVSPGTYVETIDFLGKNIEVVGLLGAASTIIDPSAAPSRNLSPARYLERRINAEGWVRIVDIENGLEWVDRLGKRSHPGSEETIFGSFGSVVVFDNDEGRDAILDGFTIRGGDSTDGGGIRIGNGSSPTIRNSVITGNAACSGGGGIEIAFASPLIENNEISGNMQTAGCSGGTGGGGILVRGAGSAEIRGNTITGNSFVVGGGLSLFAAGTPILANNIIFNNMASLSGGIDIVNASNALLLQNVISGNTGGGGDGINWLVPSGQPGPRLVNNSIVWNGSVGILADGFDMGTTLENNIIVGSPGQTAIECGDFNLANVPQFDFNNVFSASAGTAYGGICTDQTGMDGNISMDPLFVEPGADNFRLAAGSPSVDVGNNIAMNVAMTDLDGNVRIFDGDGDETATIDHGPYEQGSSPPPPPGGNVYNVPEDFETIQGAIDASVNTDTVQVAPGTYPETIDFLGKAISVVSVSGAAVTLIDATGVVPRSPIHRTLERRVLSNGRVEIRETTPGGSFGPVAGPVVSFDSGEGRASVLEGFTITGGNASFNGGGVLIDGTGPTVRNNIITGNMACTGGAGISVSFGTPLIEGNTITNNHQTGCSGGQGGGIAVTGDGKGSIEIRDNEISGNSFTSAGGIGFNAAGNPLLMNNRIAANMSTNGGGGIEMINASNVLIVQNRFEGNDAGNGEGEDISWLVPSGQSGPRMINNSIYATGAGSSLLLDGFDVAAELSNNIVHGAAGAVAVECGDFNDPNAPILNHNNVYSPTGTPYGGICGDPTGMDGNISADPMWVDPAAGDLHLQAGSPSIDAGDETVSGLPDVDFEGDARPLDGDSSGQATIDQGVDEIPETPIFADGFESGTTGAWSSASP